eukprot:TRINITY_DN4184_c0_g1_i1.p1 TRINITY_DN4184_c0_g1~~TRINITY_DN4184_c0_g1_i1.p1  ORF type:complete len:627 (+),score=147.83 TRINITY_DN4184_c0_g1_i1:204-1883(+)
MFSLKFFITSVLQDSTALPRDHPTACTLQAISAQFFGLGSISWNGIISFNLLLQLRNPFAYTAPLNKFYHLYVWTLCLGTTLTMVLIDGGYEVTGDGTCWLPNSRISLMFFLPLVTYFFIGSSALLVACIRYRSIQKSAGRIKHGQGPQMKVGMLLRMGAYIFLFVVLWTGPLVHRAVRLLWPAPDFDDTNKKLAILYYDAIGQTAQGFLAAMIWMSNPSFFKAFKKRMLLPVLKKLGAKGEKVPLLPDYFDNKLSDSLEDIHHLDSILRGHVITCLLLGTKASVRESRKTEVRNVVEEDYHQINNLTELPWEDGIPLPGQFASVLRLKYSFTDYAPKVFAHLRELAGVSEEEYLDSLEPSRFLTEMDNQKFSEGRSGSFFVFSPDKQLILKSVPRNEAALIIRILPKLHKYLVENPDSLIIRFLGVHAIGLPQGEVVYTVVMQNIFNSCVNSIHEKYDLKGSWINRKVGRAHDEDPSVLGMDIDFLSRRSINLLPTDRTLFLTMIERDAAFFRDLNIMDYSLLIGFHFVDRRPKPELFPKDEDDVNQGQEMTMSVNPK